MEKIAFLAGKTRGFFKQKGKLATQAACGQLALAAANCLAGVRRRNRPARLLGPYINRTLTDLPLMRPALSLAQAAGATARATATKVQNSVT